MKQVKIQDHPPPLKRHNFQSTFIRFRLYFMSLKWIGIFPYEISLPKVTTKSDCVCILDNASPDWLNSPAPAGKQSTEENPNGNEPEIIISASKWFKMLNIGMMTFFLSYGCFLAQRLIHSWYYFGIQGAGLKESLGTLSWFCSVVLVFISQMIFYTKRSKICEFLKKLYDAETRIQKQLDCAVKDQKQLLDPTNPSRSSFLPELNIINRSEDLKNRSFFFLKCYIILALSSIIGSLFNQTAIPRFPAYLYSYLPEEIEIQWFEFISIGLHQFSMITTYSITFILIMFSVVFTHGILQILDYNSGNRNSADNQSIIISNTNEMLNLALKNYAEAKLLVENFNELFSGLLLCTKLVYLINLCVIIYIPITVGSKEPFAVSFMFIPAASSVALRLYLVLYTMSNVYIESMKFKENWSKILSSIEISVKSNNNAAEFYVFQRSIQKLLLISPIQFRCGNFYYIYPSTILTFFSIVTTYLIFLLQI